MTPGEYTQLCVDFSANAAQSCFLPQSGPAVQFMQAPWFSGEKYAFES